MEHFNFNGQTPVFFPVYKIWPKNFKCKIKNGIPIFTNPGKKLTRKNPFFLYISLPIPKLNVADGLKNNYVRFWRDTTQRQRFEHHTETFFMKI